MSQSGKYRFIVLIFLLPLLFINVKDSHDWGDDFAQYLIQARNIIEGRPQIENGLVKNENEHVYAIQAYPAGFPLMLAPVYFFSKLSLRPYLVLISVLLIGAGLFCFEYFRKQTNFLLAFLITLLFCYNPAVLNLKKQILSEIPFTCFLMISLFWPYSKLYMKKYSWIFTGLLIAFLISIRLAGITALVSYIIFELNNIFRSKSGDIKKPILKLSLSIGASIIFFILLNGFLFSIKPASLFNFYSNAFKENEISMSTNFQYYYSVLKYILPFFGAWIPASWLIFAFIGWFIRFIKFRTLSEYFFPLYLLLIIFYPYSQGGNRFIIPLLPLLFFYLYYFFNWLFYWFGKKPIKIPAVILIILLLAYTGPLKGAISDQMIEDGPQKQTSIEMLDYLRSTSHDIPVVFCRARAMALYSGHPSLYFSKDQDEVDANKQFQSFEKIFLVLSKSSSSQVTDIRLKNFIAKNKSQYESIWENEEFIVYRKYP